jgi:hypothetical protein
MMTLDDIVDMDSQKNVNLPWNKLDKSQKLKKLNDFADKYSLEHKLDEKITSDLKQMLKEKLNRKCLQKIKDVQYNKETEMIISIPTLILHNHRYTLKVPDNVSPLHSLAPKNKTVKKTD